MSAGRAVRLLSLGVAAAVAVLAGGSPPTQADTGGTTQLVLGGNHTCLLQSGGQVVCWGANGSGQLGDGTTVDRDQPTPVVGLAAPATTIDAGPGHTCAVITGGQVACWGRNRYGQLGDGTTTNRSTPTLVAGVAAAAVSVSAGGDHTCALLVTGGVECWGSNGQGQLGDGTTTDRHRPVPVVGLGTGVAEISAGGDHTCVVTVAGAAECWGANGYGQDGNGTTSLAQDTPVAVSGLQSGVLSVNSGGAANACAVLAGGTVDCWGANVYGQIGDGSTLTRTTPVAVPGLSGVQEVAAGGGGHVCALLADGSVDCWGRNVWGELGDGLTTGSIAPVPVEDPGGPADHVATGGNDTCVLEADSTVRCFGANDAGELGMPPGGGSALPVDALDATAPTASISADPALPDASDNAYQGPVDLRVAATDDPGGSGVAQTRCSLDPSAVPHSFADLAAACPAVTTVSAPGWHTLYSAAVDAAGNAGPVTSFRFRIAHQLAVTVADYAQGGSVTSTPAGIQCPAACTADLPEGSVTLTPAAGTGETFAGWAGGGCSGTAACTTSLVSDESTTAVFAPPASALIVATPGGGAGTVLSTAPTGIACSSTCRTPLAGGTPVVLLATPAPGSVFAGWSGGGCAGTGACTVTIGSGPVLVAATFVPAVSALDVTLAGAGSGTVVADSGALNCGSTCEASYPLGAQVTLRAVAAPGSVFAGFTGSGCAGQFTCVVDTSQPQSVTATFRARSTEPTDVRAGPVNGGAQVAWQPPGYAPGGPITGYRLTAQPGGVTVTLPASAWSATIAGLPNCVATSVSVAALTSAGAGTAVASPSVVPSQFLVSDSGLRTDGTTWFPITMPGKRLTWCFDPANAVRHEIVDPSGMGLFDSGRRLPGATWRLVLPAAGIYSVGDTAAPIAGVIVVKLRDAQGTLVWAKGRLPAGFVVDVNVQPRGADWQPWLSGTTAPSAAYGAGDPGYAGPGRYGFESRLRSLSTGATSEWSPAIRLKVG